MPESLQPDRETNKEQKVRHRTSRLLMKYGSIAVGIVVGSFVGEGLRERGDGFLFPRYAIEYFTQQSCPPVGVNALDRVENLLQTPANPTVVKFEKKRSVNDSQYFAFISAQAEKYGLTLVSPFPYINKLREAGTRDSILGVLNSFSANFGFDVRLRHHMAEITEPNFYGWDDSRTNIKKFRQGAKALIESFSHLPVELVEMSDLESIDLVKDFKHDHAISETVWPLNRTYVDQEGFYGGNLLLYSHELGHLIDFATCGVWGSARDPAFKAANPADFKYGQEMPWSNTTATEYGATGVLEDKADIYMNLLTDGINPDLYEHAGPLRKKTMLLLARLDTHVPYIGEYLADISERPTKTA